MNLNKAIIAGRLTAAPELKTTPSGLSVTSFTVAVDRRSGKDKQTDFISCVAWRQTAEFITKYFVKGSAICIVGSIQTRKYTDKNGNNRIAVEVLADEATFVESKKNTAEGAEMPEVEHYTQPEAYAEADDSDLPFD